MRNSMLVLFKVLFVLSVAMEISHAYQKPSRTFHKKVSPIKMFSIIYNERMILREYSGSLGRIYSSPDASSNVEDNSSLDDQLILALSIRCQQVYASSKSSKLEADAVLRWEQLIDSLASEFRQLKNKNILLNVYKKLITIFSPVLLEPLQSASFEILSHAIIDGLLSMQSKELAITAFIDEITDIHLTYVEEFRKYIDSEGDDEYSQNSQQEILCYQFAGLVKKTYERISRGLGSGFDNSANVQELRLNNWVSPVYARLQRRFTRFLASNVDDKLEELTELSFDKLIENLKVEISPEYHLNYLGLNANNNVITVENDLNLTDNYPPWYLSNFIVKILRNTASCIDLQILEPKVSKMFQEDLSVKMRKLGKKLEKIGTRSIALKNELEIKQIESMLNIGHISVAAVFSVWQVRHNIVGVLGSDGKRIKDFLRPVSLSSMERIIRKELDKDVCSNFSLLKSDSTAVNDLAEDKSSALDAIPKSLRVEVSNLVDENISKNQPSANLIAAALIAHAVRITASEEFRALITYNSESTEWPSSRDDTYMPVLSAVLEEAVLMPILDEAKLHENLIAMAALEETIGVREPRETCAKAYIMALRNSVLILKSNNKVIPADLSARVNEIEKSLCMMMRLPSSIGNKIRTQAFKETIMYILDHPNLVSDANTNQDQTIQKEQRKSLLEVQEIYPWVADMFMIDSKTAKDYVSSLGQAKFDKAVGQILMGADLSLNSIPNAGQMFLDKVHDLAMDVLMKSSEAEERVVYLAGAIFQSVVASALQEYRQSNIVKAEALLKRTYVMYNHPVIIALEKTQLDSVEERDRKNNEGLKKSGISLTIGVKMLISRLGTSSVMEFLRFLDAIKSKVSKSNAQVLNESSNAGSGWGFEYENKEGPADPEYIAFIISLQELLVKEYTSGSLKRGYSA